MAISLIPTSPPLLPQSVTAVLVAAGRGTRMGGAPKQYRDLAGRTVLTRSLAALLAEPRVTRAIVVIGAGDEALYAEAIAALPPDLRARLLPPVTGGATRQASVRAGLEALADDPPELVLIHDAARPFVSPALVARVIDAASANGAVIPALPVTDTLKQIDEAGMVTATPDRASLRAVQTPQGFAFPALLAAHRAAPDAGATDDAALIEAVGGIVRLVDGEAGNIKLTHAEDFAMAERRLAAAFVTRVGQGYDVHAFGPGDHVWLGGVRIPHTHGVVAHSDGDVGLHALTDAVLGAIADGDIGTHFPPSDPQWRGASSDRFLDHACRLARARGAILDHLDITLVAEAPRIGPHRDTIRARIAAIAGVAETSVSIKATTSERMGFTGRREGLAALAIATLRLPAS